MEKIKICCGLMESYCKDNNYIRLNEYSEREVIIDTALYEANPVEIDYCPFCGKKIKLIKEEKGEI